MNKWEEYYKGELILPIIHGVSEGTLYIAIAFIVSGIYGPSLSLKEFLLFNKYNLKLNEMNGILICFGAFLLSIKSVFGVLNTIKREQLLSAFKDILIYILFSITLLSVSFLTDSIIVKEYPKFIILTFGFQFAKMMGILQLSHILGSPYEVYKPVFLIPSFRLLIFLIIKLKLKKNI